MKKLFLLIFLINTHIFAHSILIVNSHHKGYAWSDNIIKGIEHVLEKNKNVETDFLFMDSLKVTSKDYYKSLKSLYEIQLKNRKYDLVITLDRVAYDFILESYSDFFKKESILAIGLKSFSKERLKKYALETKVTVLLEKKDLKSNLNLIETFYPKIKKLYIINEQNLNDIYTESLIKELFKDVHNKYVIEYLKEEDLENLIKKFSIKEKDTAALYIKIQSNKNGKIYKTSEISDFIKNSNIPIFVTDSLFIDESALAGRITNIKNMGRNSALIALDILYGSRARILTYDKSEYIFNEQRLNDFALNSNPQVPYNYQTINKRENFYDKYSSLITFVGCISPFLVLLVLGVLYNLYFRKRVEKSLKHRIEFDELLLNTIESPIFWQNEKGIILEANKGFCSLLSLEVYEIIGKKLDELDSSNAHSLKELFDKKTILNDEIFLFKYKNEKNEKFINLVKQAHFYDEQYNSSGTVTILTDITQERKLQKQREKEQQYIMQQSKLAKIGEIFSSIAHQWKAPLVEITTIAQESFYACDENIKHEKESYVGELMTQVNYMNDTINNFQDFIIPTNKKTIFNVHHAIKEILEIVDHNIKYNYINIGINIKSNTNLNITGYKNQFMQAFLNIISNSKDEFINREIKNRKINVDISNKQNTLILAIQDNAGGIKLDNPTGVFKQYFTTKSQGDGIGLYMVKFIIEDKMNGRVFVKNKKDGACFVFILRN